jgi:hypothetical protein
MTFTTNTSHTLEFGNNYVSFLNASTDHIERRRGLYKKQSFDISKKPLEERIKFRKKKKG